MLRVQQSRLEKLNSASETDRALLQNIIEKSRPMTPTTMPFDITGRNDRAPSETDPTATEDVGNDFGVVEIPAAAVHLPR